MLKERWTDQSRAKWARRGKGGKVKERVLLLGLEPGHASSELHFLLVPNESISTLPAPQGCSAGDMP